MPCRRGLESSEDEELRGRRAARSTGVEERRHGELRRAAVEAESGGGGEELEMDGDTQVTRVSHDTLKR